MPYVLGFVTYVAARWFGGAGSLEAVGVAFGVTVLSLFEAAGHEADRRHAELMRYLRARDGE